MDLIGETFRDVEESRAEGAGHFVHYEAPDLAAAVARFFLDRTG